MVNKYCKISLGALMLEGASDILQPKFCGICCLNLQTIQMDFFHGMNHALGLLNIPDILESKTEILSICP